MSKTTEKEGQDMAAPPHQIAIITEQNRAEGVH